MPISDRRRRPLVAGVLSLLLVAVLSVALGPAQPAKAQLAKAQLAKARSAGAQPAAARLAAQTVTRPGFQEKTVLSGLTMPTSVEFAADGRVFVSEKSGLIKVFDSLTDPEPSVYADLRVQVHNYWDRGLLGMALHPKFPQVPRIYVLYTRNAELGGAAPRWPSSNGTDDECPDPPEGCLASGRLSVLVPAVQAEAAQDGGPVNEQPLVDGWCDQSPSHHVGTVAFGADGMLYAGGGDGASFLYADYGQKDNACGDPPSPAGTPLKPPTTEGGALRAQDFRTTGDPTGLNGTIIRVNPDTGAPAAGNPVTTGDENARRIIGYGFRNPYRFTMKPGTSGLWIGDVGNGGWEEIDRIFERQTSVRNFGWPCYEGTAKHAGFVNAGIKLCDSLYAAGPSAVAPSYYIYDHWHKVVPNEPCGTEGTSITGLAFHPGGTYPAGYKDALFFTDYGRQCVWAMKAGTNGLPDPTKIETFASGLPNGLVELQTGPGGDLFGVDIAGGRVIRYVYNGTNNPPVAAIKTDVTSGALPLTVHFDGTGSTDADNQPLTYSWDLNGDGTYGDATGPAATGEYATRGRVKVGLQVSDGKSVDHVTTPIYPGNTPPVATITSPGTGTTWAVGDRITFTGTGTDAEDTLDPGTAMHWQTIMHHCPSGCHQHVMSGGNGTRGELIAPDHEYPSWIELRLTVTDSDGQSDTKTLALQPRTARLKMVSDPPGVPLTVLATSRKAPYEQTVIHGSSVSIAAPTALQWINGYPYEFAGWSDGKAAAHNITAGGDGTYTATYKRVPNLALFRTTKASSFLGPDFKGPKAIDGRLNTRWSSKYASKQWLQVDLGAVKTVRRTILRWEKAYAKDYRVYVSKDGRTWTRVYGTTKGDGGVDNITFAPRDARYVRMYGNVRGTRYGFSLWEFEVYAK